MKPPIYYCGIGSRDTPNDVLELMAAIATELSELGMILRSGHAGGADLAFEAGSNGKNEIFLPWKGFNNAGKDGLPTAGHYAEPSSHQNYVASLIAESHHPNWAACSEGARKLHARNVYQILGPGLGQVQQETISKFVVCWTKDGEASGGTGQALRIANSYNLPIFNLYNDDALPVMADYLKALGF